MGSYIVEFVVHITLAYILVVLNNMELYGIAIVTSLDYALRFFVL